jgi:hypothetical protein
MKKRAAELQADMAPTYPDYQAVFHLLKEPPLGELA